MKYSVEIDWLSFQQRHSLNIFLTKNENNIIEIQQKNFSTENSTENRANFMVIWQKLLTYTPSTENVKYLRVLYQRASVKWKHQNFWKHSRSTRKFTSIHSALVAQCTAKQYLNIVSHVMNLNPISISQVFMWAQLQAQ